MLKSHERFHSENGKRRILIVDDEEINRELLRLVLQDDYETLMAKDGASALQIVREQHDTLSLILLDLIMPGIHGLDLIRILKNDQDMKDVPIIVLTADQEAEVASLQLGAADFIPKPYPKKEVILSRVMRSIELSEDRDIIHYTERDSLTGLYNREFFYRYAQQYDQHHRDVPMDAIVVDIHHFRMINERYGKSFADTLLCRIGAILKDVVRASGGIVCRRAADLFLVYTPHREDYQAIFEKASVSFGSDASAGRVRLRMGVYPSVDKSIDVERRFDRAKMAADSVRGNFLKSIAFYDNTLHESEIYDEQLLEDFPRALEERQFVIYYQPKFDIRPESPVLASAEALVRWQHPKLGLVSPAAFVPLFEENGLIPQLDRYVWRATCAQIRDWKTRFGFSAPVSVNVSRIDMYDPNLTETFRSLLSEYDLAPQELLLEITESAYTQDSAQIIETVNRLREIGFRIEMDDFGTGYSSLNMISSLPIDALKLDMKFIRNAFRDGRDTRLLEVIIDIADYLAVPVIAEGVETQEQLDALKTMGCDMVQGYYFSKPVPPAEYESFLRQRSAQGEGQTSRLRNSMIPALRQNSLTFSSIAQALAADYFSIYYVDTETDSFIEFSANAAYESLGIGKGGEDFFNVSRVNMRRVIHQDDLEMILTAFTKENLLKEMRETGTFTLDYRLLFDGKPTYVSMKATHMAGDPRHIVIGVNNIDAQMRRERELHLARERANRDALTGVKSKYAYTDMIETFNRDIREGAAAPFAVAVCDVNGLKTVNDTQGHQAGDKLISDAAHIICEIFRHSPVFRIGGDEFVAVMRGSDYERRDELVQRMGGSNAQNKQTGGVIIACGKADRLSADTCFEDVFRRADAAMYENKELLKQA